MAERIVRVRVTADVSNLLAGMRSAQQATTQLARQNEAQQARGAAAVDKVGRAFSLMALGGVAAATLVIAKYMAFEKQMSAVQAATHASVSEQNKLREAAMEAGAKTVFSATEAAQAEEELAKAGVSTADILGGGLTGSLNLAAAGGLGVADAAGIASIALKEFKLNGDQTTHVSDLLAAGAGKAMGSVSDLGQALQQGGLVAKQTGLSLEETTGGLAAFAAQGLLGSDAGTSFKTMLQRLTPQSKEASDEMAKLGISAYDSQGKFIGLSKFAGNLRESMADLSPEARNAAMSVIFGSDSVRAAAVLYDEGAQGIQSWITKVNDQGYAADTAAMRLDNLSGDVENFKGSLETAEITAGSFANGGLRTIVKGATGVVNVLNDAPTAIQGMVTGLGGLGVVATVAGAAVFAGAPKLLEFRKAARTISTEMPRTTRAVGALGKGFAGLAAATIAISILNAWSDAVENARVSTEELENSVKSGADASTLMSQAFGEDTKSFLGNGDSLDYVAKNAEKVLKLMSTTPDTRWGGVLSDALSPFSELDQDRERFEKLGTAIADTASTDLPAAQAQFSALAAQMGLTTNAQKMLLLDGMKPYKNAIIEQLSASGTAANAENVLNQAMGSGAAAADTAATAYQNSASAAEDLSNQVQDLISTMNKANGVGQDAVSANVDYQRTLDETADRIKKIKKGTDGYKATLDTSTKAGQDNVDQLNDQAKASQAAAQAQFKLDGNTQGYSASLRAGRKALIASAVSMGATRGEAQQLADEIYRIPTSKEIKIIADTLRAKQSIADIVNGSYTATVVVNTRANAPLLGAPGGVATNGPVKKADGGAINGPGTKTSDSIPAWLSNGEHVLTADDVALMGGQLAVYRFRSGLRAGNMPAFAKGGSVDNTPLFTDEGPDYYAQAYKLFRPYAKKGPYRTKLTAAQETAFRSWVVTNGVPFDLDEAVSDYDMRGYWKATKGAGWSEGQHFPDTYKTPYDTTFSRESKYATKANPFDWRGDDLINLKTKELIFRSYAEGGDVAGPGTKTSDSVYARVSRGEHVLTADDVDLMGGQAGVYSFRKGLRAGNMPKFAKGGAVDPDDQGAVQRETARLRAAEAAEKTAAATAKKAKADALKAKRAEAAAEKLPDKTKKQKADHDEAVKAAQKTQKEADQAQTRADKALEAAKSEVSDAKSAVQSAKQDIIDYQSNAATGAYDDGGGIDDLYSAAQNPNLSKKQRAAALKAAQVEEARYQQLTKSATDAAAAVEKSQNAFDSLTSASEQMASGIASAIDSVWDMTAASDTLSSSTKTVAGAKVQTISAGGAGINGLLSAGDSQAAAAESFANDLATLSSRGLNPKLLAEIAGYGVEKGAPIAKTLLSATDAQLAQLGSDYDRVQNAGTAAGTTVADDNYASLIAAAQVQLDADNKNAADIQAKVDAQTERITRILGDDFGTKVKNALTESKESAKTDASHARDTVNAGVTAVVVAIATSIAAGLPADDSSSTTKTTKKTKKKAGGGLIVGPGSGTSDDVDDVSLSNGEWVSTAAATAKHLRLLQAINQGRANEYLRPQQPQIIVQAPAGGGGTVNQTIHYAYSESRAEALNHGLELKSAVKF